jgi:hypothetical protein
MRVSGVEQLPRISAAVVTASVDAGINHRRLIPRANHIRHSFGKPKQLLTAAAGIRNTQLCRWKKSLRALDTRILAGYMTNRTVRSSMVRRSWEAFRNANKPTFQQADYECLLEFFDPVYPMPATRRPSTCPNESAPD